MNSYEVCLHKIVKGWMTVQADSFAEAEKKALIALLGIAWEPEDEPEREIDQITRQ